MLRRQRFLSLAGLLLALPLAPQAESIRGKVIGPGGRPAAGAGVTLTAIDRSTTTDAEGRYAFDHVEAGHYEIAVTFAGETRRAVVHTNRENETRLAAVA